MADNVTVDNGDLTDYPVSSDEGAGGHVQRVKLAYSADGSEVHVPADADGLLVNLGANNDVTVTSLPNEGQQTMANSISVAIASDQSAVAVTNAGLTELAGAITADGDVQTTGRNAAKVSDTLGSLNDAITFSVVNYAVAYIRFESGDLSGTLLIQGNDGDDWVYTPYFVASDSGGPHSSYDVTFPGTVPDHTVIVPTEGLEQLRIFVFAYTSGTATVSYRLSTMPSGITGGSAKLYAEDFDTGDLYPVAMYANTEALYTGGDVHHDDADDGNPVKIGGYASAAAPTSVSADADRVNAWFLRNGAQAVNLTAAGALIPGDATNGLDVDVTRLPGTVEDDIADLNGITSANIHVLGTATYSEGTTRGTIAAAVRRDADTTLVNTTNEIGPLQMDANGRLKVEAFSGETLPVSLTSTTITGGQAADGAAVSGNPLRIAGKDGSGNTQDIATDTSGRLQSTLVDGSGNAAEVDTTGGLFVVPMDGAGNTWSATTISGENNAATRGLWTNTQNLLYDGANWDRAPGNSTDGTLVNLGTNNDVTVTGTVTANLAAGTNTNEVVGDVAHSAGVAGNPLLIAGVSQDMDDTAPPNQVDAESDTTRLAVDRDGGLFVHPHGPRIWSYHLDTSSAQTDTTVHSAPASGLSLYVTDIVFSSGAATAINLFFEEGASKVLGPYYLEAIAGRGMALHFTTPKKITAATALTLTTSASIAHTVDVTGFTAQG